MASALRFRARMASAVAVAALALLASPVVCAQEDKSNGFGGDIDWHSWEDMKSFDYSSNKKPIMYLFSKPWCGACKRLKADFGEGSMKEKLEQLSKSFVMVNIAEDIADAAFSPDGGYIPRVIFADAKGNLRTDVKNTMGNPKYAYFYSDASQVRNGMYMALKNIKSADSAGSKEEL